MSVDVVKYAGVAGEISPTFLGRTDLEKYDLGVAQAVNFAVDYRGGLSNRPGTELVDFIQSDWKETRLVKFEFAPAVSTTYAILFGYNYIRFVQDGAYVLEAAKAITGITKASPGVVTAVGHGFATGDLVKLFDVVGMTEVNGQIFVVGTTAANTFQLKRLDQAVSNFSTAALTAYVSGGSAYRVYTVASPYADTDLAKIRVAQTRSILRITHKSYKTRTLTRVSDTNWTLATLAPGVAIAAPAAPTVTPSAAGTAGVAFAVTAVDIDGVESVVSPYGFNALCANYPSVGGSVKVTWTAVANAIFYNVYRSQVIPVGADLTRAMEVGFVGVAYGPDFTDNNVIPDFTTTPPTHVDPFADGAITYIQVTAGGAGYTRASVVSSSGGGTGFLAYPVVDAAGVLTAIVIVNPGKNYVAPVISATIGAGATFAVTQSSTSGNDPQTSVVFQQRNWFAGSLNNPLTMYATRPGQLDVFDTSMIVKDDDGISDQLDSDKVAPILHMVPTNTGLVLMTAAGIWHLTGDGQLAITPSAASAALQSRTGAADIKPLIVDNDLLYIQNNGTTARLLSYNSLSRSFAGQDLSILASHLMTTANPVIDWDFAAEPYKLVHGVRSDGTCISLALVKDQNVYGWSRYFTKGRYKNVLNLQENSADSVYFIVQRYIDGRWAKTIERQRPRVFTTAEDAWFVDCGLTLGEVNPAAGLNIPDGVYGATVTITADAAVFAGGDVNKILRAAGGKFQVTVFNSTTSVDVKILREIPDDKLVPFSSLALVASGSWSLNALYSTIFLGYPYEGLTLKVVADGSVYDKTVLNGSITLDNPASYIIAGMGYQAYVQTLPPVYNGAAIEGVLKRPIGAKVRTHETRGLKTGADLTHLSLVKDRTNEPYAEPTKLQTKVQWQAIPASRFDDEGKFYFVQDDPLPVSILSFVTQLDLGDAASP